MDTVGKYPTHRFTANAQLSRQSATASTDSPRRHQRAPRQPTPTTPTATTVSPTQIHILVGAGSPATPADSTYQRAPAARTTPTPRFSGSQPSRHRRVRHPTAHTSSTAVNTCTEAGSQPRINEIGKM